MARGGAIPPQKRLAHWLKAALYRRESLDAWLDDRLAPASGQATTAAGRVYLRLLPERSIRRSPFVGTAASTAAPVLILTLIPPEDTGGGSRPAQLAAELRRRGHAIDWRHALPIFPWPRRRRPAVPAVSVRHIDEPHDSHDGCGPQHAAHSLALVEAPHPRFVAELAQLPASTPVVYDAIDVWDGTLGAGWFAPSAERELIRRADALVASSTLLHDELARATGRDVALIPNGVDRTVFDPSIATPVPPDLKRGTPTVVYVGALWGEWVDLDLIAAVARQLPDATFNLIGPAGSRRIPSLPNVAVLGAKPQHEVPAYLRTADVTIVPFASSRLSAAVSPLKAFEYLAMERPVVSTPLPEIDGVPGVLVADGADAFADAVRRATTTPFPRDDARAFIARHTWQERVERLLQLADPGDRAKRSG